MIKLILLSLFVTFSLSQSLHAKIYKWTDKEGKVHYSATPPKDTTEKAENIEDKIKFNVGKAQPTTANQAPTTPTETNKPSQDNTQVAQASGGEREDKARMAYCNSLRQNIHTLETSKNVNLAEEGSLKPLSEKEKQARLIKEKSNLEKNCSGV